MDIEKTDGPAITKRIDAITLVSSDRRRRILPAPKSVKIELTARCDFKCLAGDTLVDTVYGKIPIKELAETREKIPVFSYKDGEVIATDAINIRKTGVRNDMVRVTFTDGTHIDCTADHRFLAFKGKGAQTGCVEWEIEAQNLEPGTRVRAYNENRVGGGYVALRWGRGWSRKRSRVVMDYLMGRKLGKTEIVHHINGDTEDDRPENLEYIKDQSEHFAKHPEIAQRMRDNNPAANYTDEWRENLSKASKGKPKSSRHRANIAASKRGDKNPNWKGVEVNHVVESVEPLYGEYDTYCMEVPETGWFFANNVLVHNCVFCASSRNLRKRKDMSLGTFKRIVTELHEAGVEEIGVFYLGESFILRNLHEYIKAAKDIGIPYVFLTTNGLKATPERVEEVISAGLDSLKFSLNWGDPEHFETITGMPARLFGDVVNNIMASRGIRDKVQSETGHRCGLYASSIWYDDETRAKMLEIVSAVEDFVDQHYWLPLFNQATLASAKIGSMGYKATAGNLGRLGCVRRPLPCWSCFTEGHITWDGEVSACCFDHDGRFSMGNMHKESFMDCWNSERFQELRSAHLAEDVTGTVCENCIAWGE